MAVLTTVKRRVLVNPGRKLSPLQKLYFGSKRQRAAIMRNRGGTRRALIQAKRATGSYGGTRKALYKMLTSAERRSKWVKPPFKGVRRRNAGLRSFRKSLKAWKTQRRKQGYGGYVLRAGRAAGKRAIRARKRNISSIVTVYPNPSGFKRTKKRFFRGGSSYAQYHYKGRSSQKRKLSRELRRRKLGGALDMMRNRRRRRNRRRNDGTAFGRSWSRFHGGKPPSRARRKRNRGYRRYHRRRNPGVIVRYRNRRNRAPLYNRRRRRNPGFMGMGGTGIASKVLGVLGGIAVTKLIMGFVPATMSTGVLGYLTTGVVAFAQGKLVGKMSKNSSLGDDFMVGGIAYLAAKILNDFFPSIGAYTGVSGMGLLGGTTFYTPVVNSPGSMGTMMIPGQLSAAIAAAQPATPSTGVGKLRRTGRLM